MKCWQKASVTDAQNLPAVWKMEKLLWNIFKIIFQFPEFDLNAAVASPVLNEQAVHALLNRAVGNSSLIWQQCLHWIYLHKVALRPTIKLSLCAALLKKGSTSVPATIAKVRHTDGGKSRDHIAPLLEVLICIIEGFTCLKKIHTDLMMQIIMPLHSPNEMVEWRDQIPVLQLYHSPLVRCLIVYIAKDIECKKSNNTNLENVTGIAENDTDIIENSTVKHIDTISECFDSISTKDDYSRNKKPKTKDLKQKSVLFTIIKSLITYWPPSYAANTPKEGTHFT